jgi:hypothetical protein
MRTSTLLASAYLLYSFGALQATPKSHLVPNVATDSDGDGLADDFEDALLIRFVPTFWVAADECDLLPAEFLPQSRRPRVASRNGTIYGQAFKSRLVGRGSALVEVHFYHLWSRDCGRMAHALDVERVSVLVEAASPATPPGEWKALYWFASAHEDTICDISHGARATALGAEEHGPNVWISMGKHASFLDPSLCGRGCGADRCDTTRPLVPHNLVNIGEPGAAMNGATWIESDLWTLLAKMKTAFGREAIARLDAGGSRTVSLHDSSSPVQAVIQAGDSTFAAVATGQRSTEAALSTAGMSTDRALNLAMTKVGTSLQRTRRALGRGLRRSGPSSGGS